MSVAPSGDQSAARDIFNIDKGNVTVNNLAPPPLVDGTLDEQPPPYYNWQPRREEQLILADLATNVQLIEILGVGGYGKTALASRVFEQALEFDKRLWVSFRPLFTADQFPPFREFGLWLGRKFGYRTPKHWTDEKLATEALNRLAQQRCLLVLDNLETLLEPDGQWRDLGYRNFLMQWFGTGGRGVLLITSRERPELPNNTLSHTRSYPIGGLSVESGVALLRAQRVQGSESELKEYVVTADGHPLLLNLTVGFLKQAAGDSPSITSLKRAEFNLFEIVGLHRGDPDTSVEIILKASLQRLEQELWGVLFLAWPFPMPFTQTLLKVARGSTATEAQLRQLAKYSLLQETCRPEGWTFQFQPLIRNYLQQQTLDIYRANHDQFGEANTLQAIGDVLQFLDRRTEALENYEQAIGLYRDVGARLGEANTLKAIGDVLQFLDRRTEALEHYEQAIGIYRDVGARLGEANTLQAIGDVLQFLKRSTEALEHYEQAIGLYRDVGDRLGEANTLQAIGDVLQFLKRSTEALEHYEQAIGLYRDVGARLGEANTLKAIGDVLQFLDRRTEALEHYEQAIGIYRDVGDRLGEANTLQAIGDVLQFLKRSTEALENYEQAIGLYRDVGDRLGEANTLQAIGDVLQFLKRSTEALENYEQAIGLYRDVGARLGEANTLKAIGDVLQFLKRSTEALEHYEQAIGIYRDVGARLGEANTLKAIGDVLQFLKRSTEALEHYEQAIGIYRDVGDRLGEANTLQAIGDVLQFLKRSTEALENYEQAIGIYRDVGARLGEANTLQAIGDVLQFLKRSTEALENYEQAIGIYRDVGARLGEANVLQEYGKLQSDPTQGLNYLEQAQAIYQQIGDKYSQSRNLLFIADIQVQLEHPNDAIASFTRASAIAAEIGYEPLQTYADAQIETIRQATLPNGRKFRFACLRRGWGRFVLLGLAVFVVILIVKLMFLK